MGTTNFGKPRCANCGQGIDESPNLSVDKRYPCSKCGSLNRTQSVSITENLKIHGSLTAKGKRVGNKRPFKEVFSGTDFSHRFRKGMQKLRLIDRDKDIYEEEVTDPETGNTIHKTKEKLSDHTGHGSAKKRRHIDAINND